MATHIFLPVYPQLVQVHRGRVFTLWDGLTVAFSQSSSLCFSYYQLNDCHSF